MLSSLVPLAADVEHELPVPAPVIGITIFAVLCVMMAAVLIFGRGRPHA